MSDVVLSPGQSGAADLLVDRIERGLRVSSLAGAAGTGKTTLSRWLSEALIGLRYHVLYAAPTGKAAIRLQSVVHSPVHTLHSLVYRRVRDGQNGRPIFLDPRENLVESAMKSVLFVDEASMVSEGLAQAVEKAAGVRTQVIYAGDQQQLLPVKAKPGVDLARADALLTEVHRQALDNPILAVATMVIAGKRMPDGKIGDAYERRTGSLQDAAAWLIERIDAGVDASIICSTNDLCKRANRMVRLMRGIGDAPVQPGEQLIVLSNNHALGRANGETLRVTGTDHFTGQMGNMGLLGIHVDDDRYLAHMPSMDVDSQAFKRVKAGVGQFTSSTWLLHLGWGYAITVHKAQGSEYREVCFVTDGKTKWRAKNTGPTGKDEIRRMAYTALTRGKERALVLDVP